ncbi:5-oxoprolinase subunit PxpA [Microbacterium gorillae]|uniref:5-oxoprolinase subunit PxpA n=1 Tax=Microbacterium gorillae TaxID=1231063 RepID=UPI00058F6518|nr:5-oxoprolinase subunit PxpA [Microbacterium gorillae]
MTASIDLNADLGETVDGVPTADDESMFALITSANVACGGHAGDDASIRATADRGARFGVTLGAHPSYPDPANFGRHRMDVDGPALTRALTRQLRRFPELGVDVRYVKPHGALYNEIVGDPDHADAVVAAVRDLAAELGHDVGLLVLGGQIERRARAAGIPVVREAFLDRGYRPDGTLVPRREPGAVLHDVDEVAARAVRLAADGTVTAVDGSTVAVDAASLCLHGDTAEAVAMAVAVRTALAAAGVIVRTVW